MSSVLLTDIGDQAFLTDNAAMMDSASFIGFPGSGGVPWWDEGQNLPIARNAVLASTPSANYQNRMISTTHIGLVSGYSFGGSSGSPLLLHQKGSKVGPGLQGGGYVPPRLIGIMSGHYWDSNSDTPEMFRHTGLSYYTQSTAILELLHDAK